jgi:hypothetical protein
MEPRFLMVLLVLIGAFSIFGGAANWPFFMNSRKAQRLVALIGVNATRGFYVVIGLFLVVLGIAAALGYVDLASTRRHR